MTKTTTIFMLYLTLTSSLQAQVDSAVTPTQLLTSAETPVPKPFDKDLKLGFLLRGKAAYFAVIEDLFFLNYTIGAEFRFAKNHSVGIDYIFMEKFVEQEQYYDTTDYSKYREYRQKYPRHALHVDYRYYLNWDLFYGSSVTPYVNVFGKYGKAGIFAESEYDYTHGDIVRQWETFYDVGSSIGLHIGEYRWGLDVNVGAYKRFKTEDIVTYSAYNGFDYVYGKKSAQIRPIIRLNLFVYLFTK